VRRETVRGPVSGGHVCPNVLGQGFAQHDAEPVKGVDTPDKGLKNGAGFLKGQQAADALRA